MFAGTRWNGPHKKYQRGESLHFSLHLDWLDVMSLRLRTATMFLQVQQEYFADLKSPFLPNWKL